MGFFLSLQDKMDGFVPAHFLGWYIKVGLEQKKTQNVV